MFASDIDRWSMQTLDEAKIQGLAFQQAKLVAADVTAITADMIRGHRPATWRPTVLAGGPPCQPFSSAGAQRGLDDPRGQLFWEYLRLARDLRPDFLVFENVRGLVTARTPDGQVGGVLRRIVEEIQALGYATRVGLLNAADYGAPQRRVRLYVIASRRHELPAFPTPTHSREPHADQIPWLTLGEVLRTMPAPTESDIVRPSGKRADEILHLIPGTGLRTGGAVEANRPGGHWGYRQDSFMADLTLPARTIRAASTPDWVRLENDVRRLTWRECARLQGFPANWPLAGPRSAVFKQIGNAVQVEVARQLGLAILRAPRHHGRPESAPLPARIQRNIRYTEAEHSTNGHLRKRQPTLIA